MGYSSQQADRKNKLEQIMDCTDCQGFDEEFDREHAINSLNQYRDQGPNRNTQKLLDALSAENLGGMTLMDIGGGVGVIQNELMKRGIDFATSVEASDSYAELARQEARRQGHLEKITFIIGDFVELAERISKADIVTLDSVLCCYRDMKSLVSLSVALAKRYYGLVYPRDNLWGRAMVASWNIKHKINGKTFRDYSHSAFVVDSLIRGLGMKLHFQWQSMLWQIVVYKR